MALEDQIWLLQLNANDREIAEEAQKWDKLIEQADAAGIDSTNLVKLKNDAINALVKKQGEQEQAERKRQGKEAVDFEKRKYDAMRDVTQSYLSSIGSLLYIFGAKQSEMINWQKTAAATQIVIDTATAISSITAKSTQGDPYTYAARVAIGVATVLANIAKAKQLLSSAEAPPPPQLYEGGRLPGGTVMPGTAASSDNLIVVDPQSGRPVATVASGEAVLSIETYKNNRPLVDALLDSSMNKGGASIIPAHFIGGLIDRPLTVAMQPNLPAISRSIAIDKFGSSSQAGQTSSETLSNSANIESLLILHESRVGQMMELFEMRLKDLEVVGRWDWERYKETTTRMNKLEKDSKIF